MTRYERAVVVGAVSATICSAVYAALLLGDLARGDYSMWSEQLQLAALYGVLAFASHREWGLIARRRRARDQQQHPDPPRSATTNEG